jgi:hypothetical protein
MCTEDRDLERTAHVAGAMLITATAVDADSEAGR